MEHFHKLFALLSELDELLGRNPAFEMWVQYNQFAGMPLLIVESPYSVLCVGTLDQAVDSACDLIKVRSVSKRDSP